MEHDYYAVLGIDRNATKSEIKEAYRFLAAQLHPDKHCGKNVKIAEKKIKEINEAYEVLSDEAKRDVYDNAAAGSQGENDGSNVSGQEWTDNDYDEPQSYDDYVIDQEILREHNSHQSGSKTFIIALFVSIVAGIFFINIVQSCPARKEPNRAPLPTVEYVLPKTDGSSIVVKSDILTKHFGISYEQRQSSNLFMKDSYEYRYNGNGTWTITKKSAVNNTGKNFIDTSNKDEVENYLHGLGF
jgi:hypothetical protein